jgi:hypothetical protein
MQLLPHFDSEDYLEGFSSKADYFGLEDFGDRLANLLINIEDGSSFVLDGKWGTGKTHFAKLFEVHLSKSDVPAIYFNAFEHDHMAVPFEAICAAITQATDKSPQKSEVAKKKFLEVAGKVGAGVALTAGKIGLRLATAGAIDGIKLDISEGNSDNITSVIEDAVEKSVKSSILSGVAAKKAMVAFKKELSELRQLLCGENDKPLVIIIDELDRCRPDFAIGILESIKHFFGIKRVHFLLVTNLEQMNAYANHLYGTGGKSEEYLSKFYDLPIPFPPRLKRQYQTRQEIIITKYFESYSTENIDHHMLSNVIETLTAITKLHETSLRETYKICASVRLALLSLGNNQSGIGYLIVPLCAMKYIIPDAYKSLSNGVLELSDGDKLFGQTDPDSDRNLHHNKTIFRFHVASTEAARTEEFKELRSSPLSIRLERTEVLPWLIHSVIETFAKFGESDSV